MNNNTDTEMNNNYKKELITKNISINLCKECEFFNIKEMSCNINLPDANICNLLKVLKVE